WRGDSASIRAECANSGQNLAAGLPRRSKQPMMYACEGGRDGRVVDGGGLENHCTGNRTGGSNPSPSDPPSVALDHARAATGLRVYLAGWMRRFRKAPGMLSTHRPTSPSRCPRRSTTRHGRVLPSTDTLTFCFVTSMRA